MSEKDYFDLNIMHDFQKNNKVVIHNYENKKLQDYASNKEDNDEEK